MPFSVSFTKELLEIEVEEVGSQVRGRLLAIVGVLYSNLSRQPLLLKELRAGKLLKEAILSNYCFIEEPFTGRLFNQTILRLQSQQLAMFTLAELERYGIRKALVRTLGQERSEALERGLVRLFGKGSR